MQMSDLLLNYHKLRDTNKSLIQTYLDVSFKDTVQSSQCLH